MQGGSRLKGRFVARFAAGVSIDEEEEENDDIGAVVVVQHHFQLTSEQISSLPLAVIKSAAPAADIRAFQLALQHEHLFPVTRLEERTGIVSIMKWKSWNIVKMLHCKQIFTRMRNMN